MLLEGTEKTLIAMLNSVASLSRVETDVQDIQVRVQTLLGMSSKIVFLSLSSADLEFPKDNQTAETSSRGRTELLQRISKLDFRSKQADILGRRSPDTGTWLLKDEKFQQRLGGEGPSCLWCPGIRKHG